MNESKQLPGHVRTPPQRYYEGKLPPTEENRSDAPPEQRSHEATRPGSKNQKVDTGLPGKRGAGTGPAPSGRQSARPLFPKASLARRPSLTVAAGQAILGRVATFQKHIIKISRISEMFQKNTSGMCHHIPETSTKNHSAKDAAETEVPTNTFFHVGADSRSVVQRTYQILRGDQLVIFPPNCRLPHAVAKLFERAYNLLHRVVD